MERINDKKFSPLNKEDMALIIGGAWYNWNQYNTTFNDDECGGTLTQRLNWWGLHGTDDITPD